jgi:hypothetical protein
MPDFNSDHLLDVWLGMCARTEEEYDRRNAVSLRPPSLRDAAYAYVLSARTDAETTPEMIESFVNGLELGAVAKIRAMMQGAT